MMLWVVFRRFLVCAMVVTILFGGVIHHFVMNAEQGRHLSDICSKLFLYRNAETSLRSCYNNTGVMDVRNRTTLLSNNNNTNGFNGDVSCGAKTRHVAFLKVHKAGSTTVMNILHRFAHKNDLILALPEKYNQLGHGFGNLMPLPANYQYDMLINHVAKYDRKLFESVLPADTKYIGIIREPLMQTVSAFEYFKFLYKQVPDEEKLSEYLQNRDKYEFENAERSYTNNRMSLEFGLPQMYFHNPEKIVKFLAMLDSEMDLVLVLERLTESLILLKRLFCWQLKDVIYLARNRNTHKHHVSFTSSELAYHRNFSFADYMLYDYFTTRLDLTIQKQPRDFQEEVEVFNVILAKVKNYCHNIQKLRTDNNATSLFIPATKFNKPFEINVDDCRLLTLREMLFVDLTRQKQEKLFVR